MKKTLVLLVVTLVASPAFGGVVDTVVDTTLTGATVDANVGVGEYIGTVSGGGTGFGGPVGNGTLSVDSDLDGIYVGFSNMGDISNNSIRVYFDVVDDGYNELSDTSGFNDFADFGRERLSRPASNGLFLPFDADYGWIISSAYGGFQALFQLVQGGDNSLNYSGFGVVADPIGEYPSNPTYEFFVPYADIGGIPAGSTVDFAVIYGNNSDQDNAYMSDEGFPYQFPGGNPGNGTAYMTDFHRLVTIPEPASLALLAFGGLLVLRRRR